MYFFMIITYILSFISLILLILSGFEGVFKLNIYGGLFPTPLGFITAIVYLFTEVLVMFFFVGTGVSIKEFVQDNKLDSSFHARSFQIKRELYPPTLLNVFLIMTVFIIGGGVDTKVIPNWIHGILFYISFFHFLKLIVIQHKCFKDNTTIVLEMTGLTKKNETDSL